jgi:hypothetical protein
MQALEMLLLVAAMSPGVLNNSTDGASSEEASVRTSVDSSDLKVAAEVTLAFLHILSEQPTRSESNPSIEEPNDGGKDLLRRSGFVLLGWRRQSIKVLRTHVVTVMSSIFGNGALIILKLFAKVGVREMFNSTPIAVKLLQYERG